MLSHLLYRSVYFPRLGKKSRQKSKGAKMARRDDDYKFLQIADAIASINQRVNLIGVVSECGLPKQSKGTDCCVSIRIIDESRPSHGLSVNFFAETMDKLPQVMADGDIVQLSQVVMKTYGPDAVNASYNKKFSSFALYEGKHGTSFTPYQCSNKFHARELDNKFILGLRKWLTGEHFDAGASATTFITRPADLLQLKDLREGIHFNLVCKILHARETKRDGWMLFVWDGTDTPPVSMHNKLEDEMETSLPLQLESIPLSRNVLCTFPPCGTVLRITVDSGNLKFGLNRIKTGQWVKLLSLRCEVRSSLWCAVLMPFTKLCNLSDDDDLVLKLIRSYDDRFSSKFGCMPLSCFPWHSGMTRTSCSSVPFTTLMNVLTYPEVTYRFRCVVRIAAALPWRVSDLRSPSGTYRIRLTLEDPTARIHAFLYADDAEEFFSLIPSADELSRKWNQLLGVPTNDDSSNAPRSPPWFECCLKSYYLDKGDVWGSRNYRIFETTLLKRP